ncbi:MAG TPA: GH32 C-terminal domain-containing protein [Paenibacillus sp.]|nr:GH32 C-terminal domain-containing protein [Paenibacillus sp.]
MALPREWRLVTVGGAVRLAQTPVHETQALRSAGAHWTNQAISSGDANLLSGVTADAVEIVAEFRTDTATATEFGLKVRKGEFESTVVGYDRTNGKLFVDRSNSGDDAFHDAFPARHEAPLAPDGDVVKLRIVVDRASVEAFGNDGKAAITDQIFPLLSSVGLEAYAVGGSVTMNSIAVYPLVATGELPNHDFEEGNLNGWQVASGDAFEPGDVTTLDNWGWGRSFRHSGNFHLWSYYEGGDASTGELRSANFVLGGSGTIDFLIGGGNDIDRLYVALVDASTGQVLHKATGNDAEGLSRAIWDASAHVGKTCYIRIFDGKTGGWGHINVDDVNVPVKL